MVCTHVSEPLSTTFVDGQRVATIGFALVRVLVLAGAGLRGAGLETGIGNRV